MKLLKSLWLIGLILCLAATGCSSNNIDISSAIAEEIALDDMNTNEDAVSDLSSKKTDSGFQVSYSLNDMELKYEINDNGTIEKCTMNRSENYKDSNHSNVKPKDKNESTEQESEVELDVSKNEAENLVLSFLGIAEDMVEDLKVKKAENKAYYEVSLLYMGVQYNLYVNGQDGSVSEVLPED